MKRFNLIFILQVIITLNFTQNSFSDSSNNHTNKFINKSTQRTLGVTRFFGRWPNGIVPIAYNPTGEPEYCDTETMINKLKESFTVWENVADLHFKFHGIMDNQLNNYNDNLVIMGWEYSEDNWYGRAYVNTGNEISHEKLVYGYFPYKDGHIKLNSKYCDEDGFSQITITHELGHLIGFGHSENPVSFMYANPYGLNYDLKPDDILGAQRLYGVPDQYIPPPLFTEPEPYNGIIIDHTDIFITNIDNGWPWPDLGNISEITDETPDELQIAVKVDYRNAPIGKMKTYITVDPDGYINSQYDSDYLSCCKNSDLIIYFGEASFLKKRSGLWKRYVLIDNKVFFSAGIRVNIERQWNKPPVAKAVVDRIDNNSFNINLSVSDPEGDNISTIWHTPYHTERINNIFNKTVSFENPGVYEIFIEVNDDAQRYDIAGSGHQTLIHKYLVVPENKDIPTYFEKENILYIPSFDYQGYSYSAILKLTQLDGFILKLLHIELVKNSFKINSNYFDEIERILILPEVEVISENEKSIISNVVFELEPGTNPKKLKLRYSDSSN